MLYSALPYLIVCAVIGLVLLFTYHRGQASREPAHAAELAALKHGHAAELLRISAANATREGEAQARERIRERQHRDAMATLEATYQTEYKKAQANAETVISGLRAGTVRLRREIVALNIASGDLTANRGAGEAGAATGLGDGPARGGPGAGNLESVIRVAQRGNEWAVQLRACQAIVRSDREEVTP